MPLRVASLAPDEIEAHTPAFAQLLIEVVHQGAGIGFLPPVTQEAALAYWRRARDEVAAGERHVLALLDDDALVGSVQLAPARLATGRHRAEVHKLMVHPAQRRRGHARRLMLAAEELALQLGRPLLILDTFTGSDGDALYRRLGWIEAGRIPGYATRHDGALGELTLFWKRLDA